MTVQTDTIPPAFWNEPVGPRLPRIALMGEFSAGKSTLANLMIGASPLPVQVVATQLPPIWISYGSGPCVMVDLEGNELPCELADLQDLVVEDVAFIRFFCTEDILRQCEIIDMPGISDPNMDSMVWERIMPYADGVLWCSPATQAWRQSEAAVWETIEDRVKRNSLLILTRADMLLTERDKSKVLRRVQAEAGSHFSNVLMLSLAQARDAGENEDIWARSGADEFVERFLTLVMNIASDVDGESPLSQCAMSPLQVPSAPSEAEPADPAADVSVVVPRRPDLRLLKPEKVISEESQQPEAVSFMPKFS